ncbi:MAG: DUF4249 family protein, partial [Bacteroidetes bacterium]|nr:DUF4249 family protein [Bacteroidota bacterium]
MKNLTITFSVVLMLIISSACERIIEPNELPQQDPQVVVNCIVYSGSAITASITLSKSILSGKPYKTVDNAVCDVYENDNYVGKLTAAGSGNYTSSIVAQTGKKYELKVSAPGYDGVSGSTSVPDQLSVTNIERYDTTNYAITTYTYNNGMGTSINIGGSLKLKLRIVDNEPKVKNYYSLF